MSSGHLIYLARWRDGRGVGGRTGPLAVRPGSLAVRPGSLAVRPGPLAVWAGGWESASAVDVGTGCVGDGWVPLAAQRRRLGVRAGPRACPLGPVLPPGLANSPPSGAMAAMASSPSAHAIPDSPMELLCPSATATTSWRPKTIPGIPDNTDLRPSSHEHHGPSALYQ